MWTLTDNGLDASNRASREATYTLSNGYFGVRGFFEEEQEGQLAQGGIYMAGIFGNGKIESWNGMSRELVNMPNFLAVKITCDGETVLWKDCTDFHRELDVKHGILTRAYTWKNKVRIKFERFVSVADYHYVCQRIVFEPLVDCDIQICDKINTDTTNLNLYSCEPLPIQPGNKRYSVVEEHQDLVVIKTDAVIEPHQVYIKQFTDFTDNTFTRILCAYTTRDCENPAECVQQAPLSYEQYKKRHEAEWEKRWAVSDIEIENSPKDSLSVRYNLFHLMQVCPNDDARISIGARGLTGEMYDGCVFWDTEIFKLPFFIFNAPEKARELLRFRYHALPVAKEHAAEMWFQGAMYPWQSCNLGYEQTLKNGGASYAIHIVCDIAYALMQYFRATEDMDFMLECGGEMLIETSRFWASRCSKCKGGTYELLGVRGPNEYDVIVDNNCYTNMMLQENLKSAVMIVERMKAEYPEAWEALSKKVDFQEEELAVWNDIAEHILICYDKELKLYEEDDTYTKRIPLDLKKAKPTDKRVIDSTLPYEVLPTYQITKQADVICLMNNLPLRFTDEEKLVAWDYYEPKTAHDSSLSYCSYSIMAARLGLYDYAYKYFKICAYLDIDDLKLNNISGLHFANFGGTWQSIVYGFAGLSMDGDTLLLSPKMPEEWGRVSFHVYFKGNLIRVSAQGKTATASVVSAGKKAINIKICEG